MRVACVQVQTSVDDPRVGLQAGIAAARQVGDVDLVVLPELITSGYVFADPAEARAKAQTTDGPAVAELAQLSGELDAVVVAGFCEDEGECLRNSAVVLDRGEVRAVARKAHLWGAEPDFFTPSDAGPCVVDTSSGRLGVMICYDAEFPEWIRLAAEQGAELIAVPVNWPVDPSTRPEPTELIKIRGSAATSRVAIAIADCCGTDRGVDWIGASTIIDPYGDVVASAVADGWPAGPQVITGNLDLTVTANRSLGPRNHLFNDRRPELY